MIRYLILAVAVALLFLYAAPAAVNYLADQSLRSLDHEQSRLAAGQPLQ